MYIVRLQSLWFILLLLLTSCFVIMPVSAIEPIKVAVLPPVNTAGYPYWEDVQILQNTLKTPFKYPYYSLIPPDTALAAVKNNTSQNKSSSPTDEKALAQIAATLSADLVVVAELSTVNQTITSSFWQDETYVDSNIIVKCYAYSALLKKYDVCKAEKYGREPQSINTNMDIILKELTEQLLQKLPYKRIPLPGYAKPEPEL